MQTHTIFWMILRHVFFVFLLIGGVEVFGQCSLDSLIITNGACDQSGRMYVTLNFVPRGNSNKFIISGNGKNYGTFLYSGLPVTLGPFRADCVMDYEFLIRDSTNISCQSYKKIGKFCCDDLCKMRLSSIATDNCKNGKYDLMLDLKYFAPNDGFDIYNNGKWLNTYQYQDLPLKIKEVNANLNETFNKFVVRAFNDKTCCDSILLVNPCICSITNVRGQVQDCNIQNKKFNFKINFDHQNVSDSFRIGGNSFNYGMFAYKDLPVTLKNISISESIEYEFLIIDKFNSFCFNSIEPGIIKGCLDTCSLQIRNIEQIFCSNNITTLSLKIKEEFAGLNGFILYKNNQKIGNFKYGQTDYLVDLQKPDCDSVYNFKVADFDNSGCKSDTLVTLNKCCHQICLLSDLQITENCQNDKLSDLILNFKFSGVYDSFNLVLNNKYYGRFSYKSLPIKIASTNLSLPNILFIITDSKSDTCKLEKLYTVNCFIPPKCKISDVKIIPFNCESNGVFFADLRFKVTEPGSNGFILKVNGKFYDSLGYGKDSYILGPLTSDCLTKHTFSIQDKSDTLCNSSFSFTDVICCKKQCKIVDLTIIENCINGTSSLTINFKHEEVSDTFKVNLNNIFYGKFNYKDLPIKISDSLYYTPALFIQLKDNNSDTCVLEKLYSLKCFKLPKCDISDINVKPIKCNENGDYFAELRFKVTDPADSLFRLDYNGLVIDTLEYRTGFHIIGPFKGNCLTNDFFKMTDMKDSLCFSEFNLAESVCCKVCKLSEPRITILPCINGRFDLAVDFKHENTKDVFKLIINNKPFGNYRYQDLPIIISLDEKNALNILIIDSIASDCLLKISLFGKDCVSEIENVIQDKIKLYNDSEKIYLTNNNEGLSGEIRIYDMSGKQILRTGFSSNTEIDIGKWPVGIYLIIIKEGQDVIRKKIVKL